MTSEPADRLVEALREPDILGRARRAELAELAAAHPTVRELARVLMQREWLTAFQVNQLLQGRGPTLVLGPYVLTDRLGAGGMGEVFKATHRRLGRAAAVKVIGRNRLENANAVERFRREAEAAAQLSHPNIVAVHDAGREGETHYLAMEFIDGIDLSKLLAAVGPLPVGMACDFFGQAAIGLHHAHELGFVHRDIKPQNLLVAPRGGMARVPTLPKAAAFAGADVKVLDMGLVQRQSERVMATELALTQKGVVIGTMDYLAPEQARNSRKVDRRADLYSLGCTMYHALAGRPPFDGGAPLDKLLRHQTDEPPELRLLRPDVPPVLETVLRRLMAKHPDDRFATALEFAQALAPLKAAAPVPARRAAATSSMPARPVAEAVAGTQVATPPPEAPPAVTPRPDLAEQLAALEDPSPIIRLEKKPSSRAVPTPRRQPKPKPFDRRVLVACVVVGCLLLALLVTRLATVPRSEWPDDKPTPKKKSPQALLRPLVEHVPADTTAVLGLRVRPLLESEPVKRDVAARGWWVVDPGVAALFARADVRADRDVERLRLATPLKTPEASLWTLVGTFGPSAARKSHRVAFVDPEGLYEVRAAPGTPEVFYAVVENVLLLSAKEAVVRAALALAAEGRAGRADDAEIRRAAERADLRHHLWLAVACADLPPPARTLDDVQGRFVADVLGKSRYVRVGVTATAAALDGTIDVTAADEAAARRVAKRVGDAAFAAGFRKPFLRTEAVRRAEPGKAFWYDLLVGSSATADGPDVNWTFHVE